MSNVRNHQNVQPAIRFKGFTDAWEQRKLGQLSECVRGNDGRMNLPTLTISAGSGWLDQRDRFSQNIAGAEQKNYTLLRKGQLSYNHGNSKLAKFGAVFELRNYSEALVPRVYHSFDVSGHAVPAFIEYLFATKLPDRELAKLVSSGARMDGLLNINYQAFMGIELRVPSIHEQQLIAEFLEALDNTIALHQREVENLQQLKKSLLQQMFVSGKDSVPRIRFSGFTDAWEQRRLSDGMTEYTDRVYIDNQTVYRQVSVKNVGEICLRGSQLGKNIGRKRQAKINLQEHPITLVFTRQTVEQGGIGFAPEETDGAIVTENMRKLQ